MGRISTYFNRPQPTDLCNATRQPGLRCEEVVKAGDTVQPLRPLLAIRKIQTSGSAG